MFHSGLHLHVQARSLRDTRNNFCYVSSFPSQLFAHPDVVAGNMNKGPGSFHCQLLAHLLIPTWWLEIWIKAPEPGSGHLRLQPEADQNSSRSHIMTINIDQYQDIPYFRLCSYLISQIPHLLHIHLRLKRMPLWSWNFKRNHRLVYQTEIFVIQIKLPLLFLGKCLYYHNMAG